MIPRLRSVRNVFARAAMSMAKLAATDREWSVIRHDLGSPNMVAGLALLRSRGVNPRAVVDGGACVGDWTRLFKSVFPASKILMIEPQARHHGKLQQICERYSPTVQLADELIGPEVRNEAEFVVLDDTYGTGSSMVPEISNVPRHTVRLPMTTLDGLLAKTNFASPDFIKLDVQGYELEVLKGAERTLLTTEFILLEVSTWQYNTGAPLIAEALRWMDDRDFRMFDVFDLSRRSDGTLLQMDLLFIRKGSAHLGPPNFSK